MLCLQTAPSMGNDGVKTAALPMALLSAVVRKEALLPLHTAALAATQLLPVIQAAVQGYMAASLGNPAPTALCRELLVSAKTTPTDALQAWSLACV